MDSLSNLNKGKSTNSHSRVIDFLETQQGKNKPQPEQMDGVLLKAQGFAQTPPGGLEAASRGAGRGLPTGSMRAYPQRY